MTEESRLGTANPGQGRPLGDLTRRMREVLGCGDLESEEHRKASIRRLLHEHAAGLTREEITELVSCLRGRFPDRVFESDRSARSLVGRTAELEREVDGLQKERDRLRKQVDHLDSLMGRLARAAESPAGQTPRTTSGAAPRRSLAPPAQEALIEVATLLFSLAVNQEETARLVEETVGGGASSSRSDCLATSFPRLSGGASLDRDELDAISKRLRELQILPGALLAGVKQSWKGGTQDILERLDPKSTNSSILKYHQRLKEVEQQFAEFWDQLDKNIDHFYRGRFERVYRDKMEEGS